VSIVRINVVTIFPETMDAVFAIGMLSVAAKKGIVEFRTKSPREFTSDAHRTVDDSPFGGGAGMIMMAPPIVDAVESFGIAPGSPVILMSPIGKRFDQAAAQRLSQEKELTFICGRYKGVDERVKELVVCGGGAFNADLMARLAARLAPMTVVSSANRGLPPDQVEACAFAWLARTFVQREPGNIPSVTGATGPRILGALYPGRGTPRT